MKFVVERKTWWRGKGSARSRLLRPDGNMCCLGFLAIACGYTPDEILGNEYPIYVVYKKGIDNKFPDKIIKHINPWESTESVRRISHINDDSVSYTTDTDRELDLIKEFKKAGIEVTFV